jgi:hypothetical protein
MDPKSAAFGESLPEIVGASIQMLIERQLRRPSRESPDRRILPLNPDLLRLIPMRLMCDSG